MVSFFKQFLNNREGSQLLVQNLLLSSIPKLVMTNQNKILQIPLSMEEIKLATFQLHLDKPPGPNGFQALFFQKCWNIVGKEVTEVIEESRIPRKILREIINTFLVLIPKKEKSVSIVEFQPIALCNTLYKIMVKEMVNRLKRILPSLSLFFHRDQSLKG